MADAVRDGDVHAADPDDTIDAASARPEQQNAAPTGMPVEVIAATRDYTELQGVERSHYVLTRELARGGIGRVFEARDLRLGRQVAIKELLPRNRDAARRFEREARITARLQHPSIIHVYEAGVWPGGEPFYAMPLVSGRSLDKVVAEKKTLNERLGLLPNVIAVADALAYAHNSNVIHRDLKPANVLVGEFGETVVIDWGLAKDLGVFSDPKESLQMRLRATAEETMSGSVVGTPAYMPPEQARGDSVDQRADVYALGALLYKVLAGDAPYRGESALAVLEAVKEGPPVPVQEREPDAPPDLVAIVTKAMARNPDHRYITASELAQDLKRFETGQLVGAHTYSMGELMRRWLKRHRVAVSIALIAVVALIGAGVYFVHRILHEKALANSEREVANNGRLNLLLERGRSELLDNHAGNALAYLAEAAEVANDKVDGARGFLIADAKRPFEAELVHKTLPAPVVIAVSPNGEYIATATKEAVELRTAIDGRVLHHIPATSVPHVIRFDGAGGRVVIADEDGIARVWTLENNSVRELRGHRGPILDAVFSPDATQLATGGQDASVRVWTLATGESRAIDSAVHSQAVVSVRFSPDGQKLLTASADATGAICDPSKYSIERKIQGHTKALNSAEWSPDGQFIVTASDDGTARVWSVVHGKPVVAASLRHEPGTTVKLALVSTDGRVVTVGSDMVVRVWELPGVLPEDGTAPPPIKPPRRLTGHSGPIVAAAFSADEDLLVTAGLDGIAKVWDWRAGQEMASFEHHDVVAAAAFVPNMSRLVTTSRDGSVQIWNTKTTERPIELGSAIRTIATGHRDHYVAVGLASNLVQVVRPGQETLDLYGHVGAVLALTFTPATTPGTKQQLISAGEDAAAIEWDLDTRAPVGKLAADSTKGPIEALAIASEDGDRVALLRAGAIEVWSRKSGNLERTLNVAGKHIDAFAVNPVTWAVAGVGHDGTVAMWTTANDPPQVQEGRGYNAVAFTPSGDALVTAGEGIVNIWKVDGDRIGKVDVALKGDTGIVRALSVSRDGSLVFTAGDSGRALIWDRRRGNLLGQRGRHDQTITSLALDGDADAATLWLGSEDRMLSTWNVQIDKMHAPQLVDFMREKNLPVELHDDVAGKKVQ